MSRFLFFVAIFVMSIAGNIFAELFRSWLRAREMRVAALQAEVAMRRILREQFPHWRELNEEHLQ